MQGNENLLNWYAGRVRYNTEKKIKDFLVQNNITHYIPFEKKIIERDRRRKRVIRPVIPCYIFVYTDYQTLLSLPRQCGYPISYVRNIVTHHIQEIPSKQMQDFMLILDFSETTIKIGNTNIKQGDRVRVIKGDFAGIEGELIRIKGHKRVVVRLEGLFSVATTYIPSSFLEKA